jgi:hypothetical protein
MRKSMAPAALFDLTLLPPLACLQHNPHSAISALQPYLPLIDTGVWLDPKGQQRSVSSFAFSVHDLAFRERASESLFSFAICAPAAMFPLLSTELLRAYRPSQGTSAPHSYVARLYFTLPVMHK